MFLQHPSFFRFLVFSPMTRFSKALRALVLTAVAPFFLALTAQAQTPAPPEVAARSYLLLDVTANQILAQKDIDMAVEPASLTKLMSAYLVFDALKAKKISLTQTLPVSPRAWKLPGSRMFIDPKMQVPVEDLIKGMIVQSGNDATVASLPDWTIMPFRRSSTGTCILGSMNIREPAIFQARTLTGKVCCRVIFLLFSAS